MPEQLSREAILALAQDAVAQTGAASVKDMGKVMGVLMPKVKGKADGNLVNQDLHNFEATQSRGLDGPIMSNDQSSGGKIIDHPIWLQAMHFAACAAQTEPALIRRLASLPDMPEAWLLKGYSCVPCLRK